MPQPKNDSAVHMTTTLPPSIPRASRFREEFDMVTAEYPPGHPEAASLKPVENQDRSTTALTWDHILRAAGRCFASRKSSKQHWPSSPKPELEIVAPIPGNCMVASSPVVNSSVGASNGTVSTNADGRDSTTRGRTMCVADGMQLLKKADTELYRGGSRNSDGEAGKCEFVNPVDFRKGLCEGDQSDEEIMEWAILIDGL